jgi:hypothetical protein
LVEKPRRIGGADIDGWASSHDLDCMLDAEFVFGSGPFRMAALLYRTRDLMSREERADALPKGKILRFFAKLKK